MHPTEGMWQELLDGESDPPVVRDMQAHLATCTECQHTVPALGRQRVFVTGLLDRLEAAVPVRSVEGILGRAQPRTSGRWMLAAATIAMCVVTAAGATIRPDLFHRVADWVLGPRPWLKTTYSTPLPPVQTEDASLSGVAFEPSGVVEVAFEAGQPAGQIAIVLGTDSKVSINASTPVRYSVRKGRVAIANQGVSANYHIVLPRSVPLASIRIADKLVFSKHGPTLVTEAKPDSGGTYVVPFSSSVRNSP